MDLLPSAFADSFARERLPPFELWPRMETGALDAAYPERCNAVAEILDRAVERGFGDRPCLRTRQGDWSYAELIDRANRIAETLVADYGLTSGGRVLLRGQNSPMLAAAWFGVLKAGGIAVTTMALLRARELADIIDKAQIEIALCEEALVGELQAAAPCLKTIGCFLSDAPDGLEARMAGKSGRFDTFLAARDDVAIIAFTSGTTGKPKATMHFHRDLLAICDVVGEHVTRFAPGDVVIGSAPLGFTYGLGALLLFPLRRGACSVLVGRVNAEIIVEAIRAFDVNVLMIGPTLYRAVLPLIAPDDAARLRLCVSSGEALPAALQEAWRAKTGVPIRNILGSTEMLHAFAAAHEMDATPGSLGAALPGYRIEVFDEAMRPVAPGVVGKLAVRGPTGCRYLDAPEQQRAYVVDGWNLTGDSASRNERGELFHHARTDEIIVSSGYNISGAEIEDVLNEHPAVAASAVVAAPDAARGAVAAAFVVVRQPTDANSDLACELQDYVKAKLAPYKYPRRVQFVDALPLTSTGKIARAQLRALAAEFAYSERQSSPS